MQPPRTNTVEVLLFEIGNRRFGIRTSSVLEVQRAVAVVPLPQASPFVVGVINLRGHIVPVVDIRPQFDAAPRAIALTDQFVVARAGKRIVALLVERAIELANITESDAVDVERSTSGDQTGAWVARVRDELVVILDPETMLSSTEMPKPPNLLSSALLPGEKP